jgi:phosphinothricin acetyltransferase
MSTFEVVSLEALHYPEVAHIYTQGIETGQATFETQATTWEVWNSKYLKTPRYVALSGKQVAGWCALLPVSDRFVYRGVAEESVYIHNDFKRKGLAELLLSHTIQASEDLGIWTLQAGIFPENKASIHVHEKVGFVPVGIREKIGQMNGVWRDVLLMERRSQRIL